MARPYRSELAELRDTIQWVAQADIGDIAAGLEQARFAPILAVGSGGSLSAAHHLAGLQRRFHHRVGLALTPYQLRAEPIPTDAHCWIFSAGGSNVDVVAAVEAANRAEPASLHAVTMRSRSTISRIAGKNPAIRLHDLKVPTKKDGFLATNSLLAFCTVMTRAYMEMGQDTERWLNLVSSLQRHASEDNRTLWHKAARRITGLQQLVVLYDSHTSLGAFDLESKLTEAGVVGVQLADYRHFAHGRHHWLAKNGSTSGVLAFASEHDGSLAARTMNLIPESVPTATIEIRGDVETAQLVSLLAAFYITEELSFARGIDPGQPGVPEFGRRIYGLRLNHAKLRTREVVSVARKQSQLAALAGSTQREEWGPHLVAALRLFEHQLERSAFAGVVLDYDGTIVDTPDRFEPPRADVTAELVRLLDEGLRVGVATGRGRSAGRDLRSVVPKPLWQEVLIGYYNGAILRDLSFSGPLDEHEVESEHLKQVWEALRKKNAYEGWHLNLRPHQLTVQTSGRTSEATAWDGVRSVVDALGYPHLTVSRSSHSIDVLDATASKLNVVGAIAAQTGVSNVLRMGDRGRWPGNDFELLASPMGLSVDQVSSDLSTCWHTAPEGVRGSRATLYHLRRVQIQDGLGRYGWEK